MHERNGMLEISDFAVHMTISLGCSLPVRQLRSMQQELVKEVTLINRRNNGFAILHGIN